MILYCTVFVFVLFLAAALAAAAATAAAYPAPPVAALVPKFFSNSRWSCSSCYFILAYLIFLYLYSSTVILFVFAPYIPMYSINAKMSNVLAITTTTFRRVFSVGCSSLTENEFVVKEVTVRLPSDCMKSILILFYVTSELGELKLFM